MVRPASKGLEQKPEHRTGCEDVQPCCFEDKLKFFPEGWPSDFSGSKLKVGAARG